MALIYYLTHIHLEFGARSLLGSECERVGIKKVGIIHVLRADQSSGTQVGQNHAPFIFRDIVRLR